MMKRIIGLGILVLAGLSACLSEPTYEVVEPAPELMAEVPTPTWQPGAPVISEVLPGLPDNHYLEFIEFYNTGAEFVDLIGWSLWYRIGDNQEEKLLYTWEHAAALPGYGHYLLALEGQDVGVLPDAMYTTPIFDPRGGLALRDPEGETVDALGWGTEAPLGYVEGTAAPTPLDGASLERLPGGAEGHAIDTGNNGADFAGSPAPDPQNTGSPITPLPEQRLMLNVTLPELVAPGSELAYVAEIKNLTGSVLQGLRVSLPLPPEYIVCMLPANVSQAGEQLTWRLPELLPDKTELVTITLRAPLTYATTQIGSGYVESVDWPLRAYSGPQQIVLAGGAIPIGTARTLVGKRVTVEGIATMYTGGFYAGSTGTKFYVQDETGGVQVYCPGGQGVIAVEIGQRVRVSGEIELYRNAVELVPETYPDDVEILSTEPGEWPLPSLSIASLEEEPALLGSAGALEGTLTQIQEFDFSYELDLADDEGNAVLVYVEKETGIDAELLEVGRRYRVTGINELYMDTWEFKPRVQADFARVYPPELLLELHAQNSVLPGELLTYTVTAANHTATPLTNVFISASLPPDQVTVERVLDNGVLEGAEVTWTIADLPPEGGSTQVRCLVRADKDATGQITSEGAVASANEWPEPVVTSVYATFVGTGAPIWAIQGAGTESPYVHETASTEGVVTGVFPELGGFWIQAAMPDDDPATSEGLFVLAEELELPLTIGDRVIVTGKIREKSGQTLLQLQTLNDLVVIEEEQATPLPEAIPLDPPEDAEEAAQYYEALEGMLVQVAEPAVAVAPTSKYGEYVLVPEKWGSDRVMRGDPTGMLIMVDDGSNATHTDLSTLPYAVKTGDTLVDVTGPLAYTYEHYKIEPVITPTLTAVELPLPSLEPCPANAICLATFNAENLFDFKLPHPSDPPQLSIREYRARLEKVADAVVRMGLPTIVGFQEIENLGVLEDLAEQEALAAYSYMPFLVEGTDSRGIDNAFLVRGDRASVTGAAAYPAPDGLTSRPPLMITATVELASGPQTIVVLNNHFTSMAEGEERTEPRRTAQAAWNVTLVEKVLARDPSMHVAVMGDLNSFYDSLPLDTLRAGGLEHVYESVEGALPYSYIYQGESETLDHILVTPGLAAYLTQVEAMHLNADYPPPIPDDPSARRVSDHDPVVAVFTFE